MTATYTTAVLRLASYYVDNKDDITGDYIDGAVMTISNVYGVSDERIRRDMYKMIDILIDGE